MSRFTKTTRFAAIDSLPCQRRLLLGGAALLLTVGAFAAEPSIRPEDLPRTPATAPSEALGTLRARPGFHVELAASEPLVADPIAMAFDENGRLFVIEMRDYSERRDERLGRIRLLEDVDDDGRFDKSTVFAEGLPWPTAIACFDGGVFVGSTPDILYLKDTDRDGIANTREVAFTGFGSGMERLNVQQLLNSFHWGLDNRIHGATGGNWGRISSARHPNTEPMELRGRDFSFDPRTLTLRAESGGAQHGMSFDNWGRKFVCSNSAHLQMVMFEELFRPAGYSLPHPVVNIADDGPAAEVYRLSPDEPWRVIRTRWRIQGTVPGPVEGGGRASGYFTAATGITIYRGDAFPEADRGDAFIGDAGSNLIHRKKLRGDGVMLKGTRAADEAKSEFVASTDNWFRPVQFANAPDGCLYVADMYRETIEHPWSIPEPMKRLLDLNSGNDRGRIYRLVPDGHARRKQARLGEASTPGLVRTLEHANGWHRDTAARLLNERQDRAALPLLQALLANGTSALGRLHALYALDGFRALDWKELLLASRDAHPGVRRHAVRLGSLRARSEADAAVRVEFLKSLQALAGDPDPEVRYQVAFALGTFSGSEKRQALSQIFLRDAGDPWIREALLSSARNDAAELFTLLAGHPEFPTSAGGSQVVRGLVESIARQKDAAGTAAVLAALKTSQSSLAIPLAAALFAGGAINPDQVADGLNETLQRLTTEALSAVANPANPESLRIASVRLLSNASADLAGSALLALLHPATPSDVQSAALHGLDRLTAEQISSGLLERWDALSPRVRTEAVSILLKRSDRIVPLLQAIESGQVATSALTSVDRQFLTTHSEPAIRKRAAELFEGRVALSGNARLEKLRPALDATGDAEAGRKIFQERCVSCHRLQGEGHAVGPDLASVRAGGREKVLASVVDPNLEVAPAFLNYVVETADGESVMGILAAEDARSVTLRRAFGDQTIVPRSRIRTMRSLGQSVMPEGLEEGLNTQQIADLLEFLTGDAARP